MMENITLSYSEYVLVGVAVVGILVGAILLKKKHRFLGGFFLVLGITYAVATPVWYYGEMKKKECYNEKKIEACREIGLNFVPKITLKEKEAMAGKKESTKKEPEKKENGK